MAASLVVRTRVPPLYERRSDCGADTGCTTPSCRAGLCRKATAHPEWRRSGGLRPRSSARRASSPLRAGRLRSCVHRRARSSQRTRPSPRGGQPNRRPSSGSISAGRRRPPEAASGGTGTPGGVVNVRFLDPIPKREIPALLGAIDAGLHVLADVPLFSYGVSPNKIFDYMAAGVPVLTNTPGEMADLIESAGAGIAVRPRELARGVRMLVSADASQLARWGEAGRRFVTNEAPRTAMAVR